MTQHAVVEKMGDYDHSYVSRIESGGRTPSREWLELFTAALELTEAEVDHLMNTAGYVTYRQRAALAAVPEAMEAAAAISDARLPDAVRRVLRDSLRGTARIANQTAEDLGEEAA